MLQHTRSTQLFFFRFSGKHWPSFFSAHLIRDVDVVEVGPDRSSVLWVVEVGPDRGSVLGVVEVGADRGSIGIVEVGSYRGSVGVIEVGS